MNDTNPLCRVNLKMAACVTFILFNILASVLNAQVLPTPRVVVSMGDSYASGNGAGNYIGVGECFRSSTTWGAQFAQSIAPTFINRGCSGGKFVDILELPEKIVTVIVPHLHQVPTNTIPITSERQRAIVC
jgi:hypothetical protein